MHLTKIEMDTDPVEKGEFVGFVDLAVTSRYTATPAEAARMREWFEQGWPFPKAFIDALNYGMVEDAGGGIGHVVRRA